jgi:hypothetical protein
MAMSLAPNARALVDLALPDLTPEAKEVLTVVVEDDKTVDGGRLLKVFGFDKRDKVREAVRVLQGMRIIDVGGSTSPEEFPFAKIVVKPSAREFFANLVRALPK